MFSQPPSSSPKRRSVSSGRRASLERIAQEVGVSIATVSRVLNEKPGISEEVRQKVTEALSLHAYRRRGTSEGARAKTEQKAIAFVVSDDLFDAIRRGNEFYGRHLFSVQKGIAEAGFYPMLLTEAQDKDEAGRLRCVVEKRVEGVIFESWDFRLAEEMAKEVPVVMFNRATSVVDCVTTNIRAAAAAQLQYLSDLGHRSIACFRVGQVGNIWEAEDYWQQYGTFLKRQGHPHADVLREPARFGPGGEVAAVRDFLRRIERAEVTAIVTYDHYAPYLFSELERIGKRVPEDMGIVGFNDTGELLPRGVGLTTYRQNFDTLAREAMRLITDRMSHSAQPPRLVQLQGEMVVRDSAKPLCK